MRYGSVCSGIEAATVAWEPMGWETSFLSEIEPFPRAVLQHHYPDTPLHGDFTTIGENDYEPINLLVGGTPCQSFSVAGLRKGLDDDRGNLALEFLRLAQRTRPTWVVWENVPGVLSSGGGRDFGSFLGGLGQLGYGFAYRVLDAQYFGVAQRRKRVFVVGYLGDWRPAAAVLFERESLQGHPAPSREKGEEAARCLRGRANSSHREDSDNFVTTNRMRGFGDYEIDSVASTVKSRDAKDAKDATDLIAFGWQNSSSRGDSYSEHVTPTLDKSKVPAVAIRTANTTANGHGIAEEVTHTLDQAQGQAVAFAQNSRNELRLEGGDGQVCGALSTGGGKPGQGTPTIATEMAVRRLTPTECERLQGFPAITKTCTITVWSTEHQKHSALAGEKNHRSPKPAG
ncbi:MAG: DNA (cytosine-5-)-methyltransferase, partial [Gammaproteobacteria bacterium]